MKLEQPSLKQSLFFVLLAGTLFSIFRYNFIGLSQFDTLPTIYRMADPNYLVNDLFTNSAAKYSEDVFFAKFILLLAKVVPIPIVFFILTVLSNIGVAVVTFFTARYLFKGNNWIGVIAVALVLTMDTMKLGYSGLVVRSDLIPSQLVRPMLLAVIYFALRNKLIWVGVISALATLIHPLEGPGVGLMVLVCCALVQFLSKKDAPTNYGAIAISMMMILAAMLPSVIPYFDQEAGAIPDDLFMKINIFRFAHHYVPSHFINAKEFGLALAFLTIVGLGFMFWRKHFETRKTTLFLVLFTAFLAAICLGGYLFVEVWPSRVWLIAQTWRFLIYFKWLGLLFTASLIWLALKENIIRGLTTWVSSVHPFLLLANLMSNKWLNNRVNPWFQLTLTLVGMVLLRMQGLLRSDLVLLIFLAIMGLLLFTHFRKLYYAGWLGVAICTVIINVFNIKNDSYRGRLMGIRDILSPDIFIEDAVQGYPDLAKALKRFTPDDAVILSPALMSELRLTANRALVVDFVGIPMEDKGMKEWYDRILTLHAPLKKNPEIILDYDLKNIKLSDAELRQAREQYGSEYAILQSSRKTVFPILYKDKRYQLIKITIN
jgi:hypothetical protein